MEFTVDRLAEAADILALRDGAQAVVLGCLSYLGMAEPLSRKIGMPVIDAAAACVSLAAACVRMKLSTSSDSYPQPPAGLRTWEGGSLRIP